MALDGRTGCHIRHFTDTTSVLWPSPIIPGCRLRTRVGKLQARQHFIALRSRGYGMDQSCAFGAALIHPGRETRAPVSGCTNRRADMLSMVCDLDAGHPGNARSATEITLCDLVGAHNRSLARGKRCGHLVLALQTSK
jgi:hypothetical protein